MLRYRSDDADTTAALAEHASLVADEVLAVDFADAEPEWPNPVSFTDEGLGLIFWLRKA